MKKLIVLIPMLILTVLTFSQPKTEQEWQEVRDRFYITMVRLESAEKVVKIQEEQLELLQKRIGVKDTIINLQAMQLKERDGQIELFKQREAKVELVPALRWDGFHLGLTAAYPFDDAVITQSTVIAGMKFDVTATARVLILGKITGMLQAGVPIRSEKFYLKVGAEWRVF